MDKTPLTARVLNAAINTHEWTQQDLAEKAGLSRAAVSFHLTAERPVRDDHLNNYLGALARHERPMLLAAWLRDTLSTDLIDDILEVKTSLIREEVSQWSPELDEEQRSMLTWWSHQLTRDPELDALFRSITRRVGFGQT